jgi:hypothetical protein
MSDAHAGEFEECFMDFVPLFLALPMTSKSVQPGKTRLHHTSVGA